MPIQIIHAGTTVRRTYCLIEDGSVVRTIPFDVTCTKPTTEELLQAQALLQAKALELEQQVRAETEEPVVIPTDAPEGGSSRESANGKGRRKPTLELTPAV